MNDENVWNRARQQCLPRIKINKRKKSTEQKAVWQAYVKAMVTAHDPVHKESLNNSNARTAVAVIFQRGSTEFRSHLADLCDHEAFHSWKTSAQAGEPCFEAMNDQELCMGSCAVKGKTSFPEVLARPRAAADAEAEPPAAGCGPRECACGPRGGPCAA